MPPVLAGGMAVIYAKAMTAVGDAEATRTSSLLRRLMRAQLASCKGITKMQDGQAARPQFACGCTARCRRPRLRQPSVAAGGRVAGAVDVKCFCNEGTPGQQSGAQAVARRAAWRCETSRSGRRNGPFRRPERPESRCRIGPWLSCDAGVRVFQRQPGPAARGLQASVIGPAPSAGRVSL